MTTFQERAILAASKGRADATSAVRKQDTPVASAWVYGAATAAERAQEKKE
jgi:hypothetical protein